MSSMEELYNLDAPPSNQWGMGKKIPIALIFVVMAQILAFTWAAATLSNNVTITIGRVDIIERDLKTFDGKYTSQYTFNREVDNIQEDMESLEERVLHLERVIPAK